MVRLLSGIALSAIFIALIWFVASPALLAVSALVAALAFREYAHLMAATGTPVPWWPSLIATIAALAMVAFPWVEIESVLGVTIVVVAAAVMADTQGGRRGAPVRMAAAVLAPVYIGLPLGSLVSIHAAAGREAVLLLVGTVVVSDSAQYYAGRVFGRTPLAPAISPGKTREGALGGFVAAPAFLLAAGPYAVPDAGPTMFAAAGVALVAAGIAGDLFESMLKRAADVKDSASLIPGHGGVLDRIDALLFATPVFLLWLRWL